MNSTGEAIMWEMKGEETEKKQEKQYKSKTCLQNVIAAIYSFDRREDTFTIRITKMCFLVSSANFSTRFNVRNPLILFRAYFWAILPSACEWKTTTDAEAEGWKGLFISSSSLAAEKAGESDGSSLSVTLAGREGSRASMGAMMQWDSRHSGLTLKITQEEREIRKYGYIWYNYFLSSWRLSNEVGRI